MSLEDSDCGLSDRLLRRLPERTEKNCITLSDCRYLDCSLNCTSLEHRCWESPLSRRLVWKGVSQIKLNTGWFLVSKIRLFVLISPYYKRSNETSFCWNRGKSFSYGKDVEKIIFLVRLNYGKEIKREKVWNNGLF
jgi:hypothetical protein